MKEKFDESSVRGRGAVGRPLQVGIVGFGQLAQNYYAPALRRMGRQLEFLVADPLESSRAAASRAFANASTFPDYRQLLEHEALQAVLVAAPPSKHLEIWRAASRRGLPVFMEKPFLIEGELEQIDPADPAWQNLMVNFNRRFWPAYQRLGQCVADGLLGRIREARFVLEVNARKWSGVSDHRARAGEGGALHDLGSQVLDLVLVTLRQQPAEILARRSVTGEFEERVELTLRLAGGVFVDCTLAYGRRNRESVTIEGERACLKMRDPNFLCWLERNPSWPGRWCRTVADLTALGYRGIFRSRSMLRSSVSASLESFFATLEVSGRFSPGFDDALRVARCTAAAAASMAGDGS